MKIIRIWFLMLGIGVFLPTSAMAGWTAGGAGSNCGTIIASDPMSAANISCGCLNMNLDPTSLYQASIGYHFICYDSLFQSPSWTNPTCPTGSGQRKTVLARGGCVADSEPKNNGAQCPMAGNPITIANGNKYQRTDDYVASGINPLGITRYYNSLENFEPLLATPYAPARRNMLGAGWRTNWDRSVVLYTTTWVYVRREDGAEYEFRKISGSWRSQSGKDVPYTIADGSGYIQITDTDDTIERYDFNSTTGGRLNQVTYKNGYTQTLNYDANNRLQSVSDSLGRTMTFNYTTFNYPNPPAGQPTSETWLTKITLPDSKEINYVFGNFSSEYAYPKKLVMVKYPDNTPADLNDNPKIEYVYEDPNFPAFMTGIINENGIRLSTYSYDSLGRVLQSTHAGGAQNTTIAYNDANTRTVTNELGKQTIYHFTTVQGAPKITSVEGVANGTCEAANQNYTYDANGYPASKTDWKGVVTRFTYNAQGLQTSRTEAFGTPYARTINTTWHGTFRVPTQIVEPGKTSSFTYDPTTGWLLSKTEIDTTANSIPYSTNGQTRAWTYTYTPAGLVDTINGPRTDVNDITDYDYDNAGNLIRVTNALNQQINITQSDPNGLPLTMVDANNVTTTMTYDPRLRLKTTTTGGATTTFDYEPAGNIQKITLPNGSYLQYGYDDAGRLTSIQNNIGERIEYTLDAMGNRTDTRIKNGANQIVYQHHQLFDALGRLYRDIGAINQTATFGYDKNDNLTSVLNPRSYATTMAYDALNRLQTETDALTGIVSTTNNAQDLVTAIADPRNVATNYVYNGFGELIYESSPDSGNITFYRDAAGNITGRVDARGIAANFTYDALNRVVTESYPSASAENRTYAYDNGAVGEYGIGRLWRITDDSGSTAYAYDARGNIVKSTHVIQGTTYITRYDYNLADQLTKITYPSGRIVNYVRDVMGRISSITTQANSVSAAVNIATSISYLPYGEVAGWNYGNGLVAAISYDADYRITKIRIRDGAVDIYHNDYGYDAGGNVDNIVDNLIPARSQIFVYDALDRLTSASSGVGGNGAYGSESYGYDASSNRTSKTSSGGIETYAYAASSNRLNAIIKNSVAVRSFVYDAAGNVISDNPMGGDMLGLDYNAAGRYAQLNKNTALSTLYKYNALGERVIKYYAPQLIEALELGTAYPVLQPYLAALPVEQQDDVMISFGGGDAATVNVAVMPIPAIAGMTHYHYDLDHNVIAESISNGRVLREYIYLPANMAAGGLDMAAASPMPLAHLNNSNNGTSTNEILYILNDHLRTPTKLTNSAKAVVWDKFQTPFGETATSSGAKETNLRLPGQYYDFESSYHYNLMRDYDARTGRYLQSDPIGLAGGMNRFAYAAANPVNFVDPRGENPLVAGILGAAEFCAANPACSGAVAAGMIYMMGDKNSPADQAANKANNGKFCVNEPISDDKFKECNEILDIDTNTCKGITRKRGKVAGTKCHQSAMERYAACLTGKPLPPLNAWNN